VPGALGIDHSDGQTGGKSRFARCLGRREYGILELLSLRKGTTLTKEMFLNHLYGGIDEPEVKIIDVFVCKLRKKLAQATGGTHYIATVWGRGYVLRDSAATAASQTSPADPDRFLAI
jgi:two-component system cell cycle response regulator CtrA